MSDVRNGALVADTVKEEELDADYDYVDVLCIGSAPIYWTIDGIDPAVGADGCYVSAPNGSLRVPVEGGGATTVKMISEGTPDYSISPDPALERSGAGLATTTVAGAVEISSSGAAADHSGTIAVGGTAQNAVAANPARRYLYLRNPSSATEPLYFDLTAAAVAASPSIRLDPGDEAEWNGSFVPSNALSVFGATAAHAYTCKEG